MVFIGQIYHNTIETCLKRIGHGGYEKWKKKMCRFVEDMSLQTHCRHSIVRLFLKSPKYIDERVIVELVKLKRRNVT